MMWKDKLIRNTPSSVSYGVPSVSRQFSQNLNWGYIWTNIGHITILYRHSIKLYSVLWSWFHPTWHLDYNLKYIMFCANGNGLRWFWWICLKFELVEILYRTVDLDKCHFLLYNSGWNRELCHMHNGRVGFIVDEPTTLTYIKKSIKD